MKFLPAFLPAFILLAASVCIADEPETALATPPAPEAAPAPMPAPVPLAAPAPMATTPAAASPAVAPQSPFVPHTVHAAAPSPNLNPSAPRPAFVPSSSFASSPATTPPPATTPRWNSAYAGMEPANGFYDTWIRNRLSLGVGVAFSMLTDSERPQDAEGQATFVGYVWKLEDVDQLSFLPEIRYWASRHLRFVLAMDHVAGRTRNYNLAKHSDGNATLMGPQLLLEFIQPLCDDTVFLHLGGGVVYDFADFDEVAWWNLGYSSEESWLSSGRYGKTRLNYFREIHVEDSFGWTVSAGCSWRPVDRLELDLSVRHTWIDPDCQFGYNYGKVKGFKERLDGDFTLDHLSVALTCSYVF